MAIWKYVFIVSLGSIVIFKMTDFLVNNFAPAPLRHSTKSSKLRDGSSDASFERIFKALPKDVQFEECLERILTIQKNVFDIAL